MSLTVIETPVSSLPRINDRAPDFEAMSTTGPVKLADYHGRWLLFFSHPADFTPVCTSEFLELARHFSTFQKLNCELLALSVDSKYSHLAWIENIRKNFNLTIPFPIIEDISMSVSTAYGMIHPRSSNVSTVRATFLIDPQGILKLVMHYPANVGRSVNEIIRLIQAVQTAESFEVSTPEGWKPGDKIMVTPPITVEEIDHAPAEGGEGLEYVDWYYCKKPLGKSPNKRLA